MKKKLIALIVALFFTLGPALKGAVNLWHGVDSLWDFLIVLVFIGLVVCLVRVVERGTGKEMPEKTTLGE